MNQDNNSDNPEPIPSMLPIGGLENDVRKFAPAFERNHTAIAEVLGRYLDRDGAVLEIASGTGQHCVEFARQFPQYSWQPSDPNPVSRASIDAWRKYADLPNIAPVQNIDVTRSNWWQLVPASIQTMIAINLLHISPVTAMDGLMKGAGAILKTGGLLYCYGPFMRNGGHTSPSNAAFDQSLRAQDPHWGLRDIAEVEKAAGINGLTLADIVEMPANNISLIFKKSQNK